MRNGLNLVQELYPSGLSASLKQQKFLLYFFGLQPLCDVTKDSSHHLMGCVPLKYRMEDKEKEISIMWDLQVVFFVSELMGLFIFSVRHTTVPKLHSATSDAKILSYGKLNENKSLSFILLLNHLGKL